VAARIRGRRVPLDPAPLLELLDPPGLRPLPVEAAAAWRGNALASSVAIPGEACLTRDLAIWCGASAWPAGRGAPPAGTGAGGCGWRQAKARRVDGGEYRWGGWPKEQFELCLSNLRRQLTGR